MLCSRFTFATKVHLASEFSADVAFVCLGENLRKKFFKARSSPCSGFTFATKAPLAGEISADVAFICLVAN